jgi:hypothetical protein
MVDRLQRPVGGERAARSPPPNRSPDATGVVPKRGRDHPPSPSPPRGPQAHWIKAAGTAAGPVGKHHRRAHIPAMWPMIREPGSAHYGTTDRPRTSASARDPTRPTRARARSVALGRSVMKRTRIRRPRARSERPWLEALSPDPRDPDIVRAKALARTAHSRQIRASGSDPSGGQAARHAAVAAHPARSVRVLLSMYRTLGLACA